MIRRLPALLALALAAACAAPAPTPQDAAAIVTLAGNPARATELVVAVPGALSPLWVFDPLREWADADTAVVAYRFPGLDGRPADSPVRIAAAGAAIAAFANARRPATVRVIGLSTGGPIALEAARRVAAPRVDAVLISTALPAPAALGSSLRGAFDLVEAADRAGTWAARPLFREYHRTLLYGRSHYGDPVRAADSARRADAVAEGLLLPGDGLVRKHSGDLLRWMLRDPAGLAHVRVRLFHGADDPVFGLPGVRRLARRLPDAALTVYAGHGHLLPETVPGLFADIGRALGRR
jgi:pimeloyl-ACP methyl ester carboxylesterase